MYGCPNTNAESITLTIKDMLLGCGLDVNNMRGQTYDSASVLQGQMSVAGGNYIMAFGEFIFFVVRNGSMYKAFGFTKDHHSYFK